MTKPAVKITAFLGAVILLAGAAFHMSALAGVKAALAGVEPAFYKNALPWYVGDARRALAFDCVFICGIIAL